MSSLSPAFASFAALRLNSGDIEMFSMSRDRESICGASLTGLPGAEEGRAGEPISRAKCCSGRISASCGDLSVVVRVTAGLREWRACARVIIRLLCCVAAVDLSSISSVFTEVNQYLFVAKRAAGSGGLPFSLYSFLIEGKQVVKVTTTCCVGTPLSLGEVQHSAAPT